MSLTFDLPGWAGIAILLLGAVAALALAAHMYVKTRSFLNVSVTTVGVIVRMQSHEATSDEDGSTVSPVVKFKTASGAEIEFESSMSSSPPLYGKGEQVPVIYNPQKPDEAEIKLFWSLWAMPVFLGGMGVFALLFALLWFVGRIVPGPVLAPVIFGLVGIGLFVAAIVIHLRISRFLRNAITTVGVVVEVPNLPGLNPTMVKLAGGLPGLVRFTAPSGAEIEFAASAPSGGPEFHNGVHVPILYDPTRPGSARLNAPSRSVAILLALLGIALLSMSIFFSFVYVR